MAKSKPVMSTKNNRLTISSPTSTVLQLDKIYSSTNKGKKIGTFRPTSSGLHTTKAAHSSNLMSAQFNARSQMTSGESTTPAGASTTSKQLFIAYKGQ